MKTEGTNLFVLTMSAFWSSWPPRWAPEGREVSHKMVVIDRFRCIVPAEPAEGARFFIHKSRFPTSLDEFMLVTGTGSKAYINLRLNNVAFVRAYADVNGKCVPIYHARFALCCVTTVRHEMILPIFSRNITGTWVIIRLTQCSLETVKCL